MTVQTETGMAQPAPPSAGAPPHPLGAFWTQFSQNTGAVIGLGFIVLITTVALLADVVAPYGAAQQFRAYLQVPPVWDSGGSWDFVLGTDATGRDILSRIIHGARFSLGIGFLVVTIALIVGVTLGLLAGYLRGILDIAIMRLVDIMLSMPSLLLAIVIVAILGKSLINTVIAVSIVVLPHYIRLTRAAVLSERTRDYVVAARLAGARGPRLMFNTILPNCLAPLIVQATLGFSTAILDAAALGFLGLGAQPPTPEWGTMLADAREFIRSSWWIVTFPGLAILVTVLAFNLLGDGLRDALDPKLKT